MQDLQSLIQAMEEKRTKREMAQMALWAAIGVVVLGGGGLVAANLYHPAPVAVAPTVPAPSAFDSVHLSAKAAVVYDLTTGKVLYEKNAEAQLPLASLTKLLTLYAAANTLSAKSPVVITHKATAVESASGLKEGDTFAFEDAARLAVVASSNDAAESIAEAATLASKSANGTALLANAASAIGLTQTYALNGTGLDENTSISGGYGSAHDIAVLAGALLAKIPAIMHATLESRVSAISWSGNSYTLENTNPEVAHIPGLMMSKTGYTDLAGGNLAVVFDAGVGHPVAVVVLGSTRDSRFTDVDQLVQATSERFAGLTLPSSL